MPLLIADLDNTLYDWVTYHARSFSKMVDELVRLTGLDRERMLDEFQVLHRRHRTSELPFAALDLPSVRRLFGGASRLQIRDKLEPALHAFNSERDDLLELYPGVEETLRALRDSDVTIVAHTEATAPNAAFRLKKLRIDGFLTRLYARGGFDDRHPDPERADAYRLPDGYLVSLPLTEQKPNPAVVADICSKEGFSKGETFFVGDSLAGDIAMAKAAGVTAIWARYGTRVDPALWQVLVRVTHWPDEKLKRGDDGREPAEPDYEIERFSEVEEILLGATSG